MSDKSRDRFRVRLNKETLVFSAAHFITFGDNLCERLHGHNYRVFVEVAGDLGPHEYVVDFIALLEQLREILLELDHHVLLPAEHPTIHVASVEAEVHVQFEDRRWVFPAEDCMILPVANTTAELLAQYLADRLVACWMSPSAGVDADGRLDHLVVGVDENHGQWAICERRLS